MFIAKFGYVIFWVCVFMFNLVYSLASEFILSWIVQNPLGQSTNGSVYILL